MGVIAAASSPDLIAPITGPATLDWIQPPICAGRLQALLEPGDDLAADRDGDGGRGLNTPNPDLMNPTTGPVTLDPIQPPMLLGRRQPGLEALHHAEPADWASASSG